MEKKMEDYIKSKGGNLYFDQKPPRMHKDKGLAQHKK